MWRGGRGRGALISVAGAGLILLLCVGVSYQQFGSVGKAADYLRGRRIFIEPAILELGTLPGGTSREALVTVENLSSDAVRLVGGKTECPCVVIPNLPSVVSPGESVEVRLIIRTGESDATGAKEMRIPLIIFTSNAAQPRLPSLVQWRQAAG
jgi:hypothetical protein